MTLRARLFFLVTLATVVPALLLSIRFIQNRTAEIESALMQLTAHAVNIADDLDEKIQGTAQLHFGLSRAVDLDNPDKTECSAFLSAVREKYPQYTGILTILPDGSLFCDSLQTNRTLQLSDRKYFQESFVARDAVVLQPAVGRLTGISVLQIAYPARLPDGQLKFVLLASFNLQKFTEFHSQRLSGVAEVLLLDKDGTVLAAPPNETWTKLTGTSIANSDLYRLASGPSAGHAEEVTVGGLKQFWTAISTPAIRDAGLYVMLGVSKAGLVAAANQRLYEELIIVGVVAFLLFAGVWTLAEIGIRRQVGRIATMAQKLGDGDLSVRIDPPYPEGELGGLMTKLNATAESLQRQHASIDELNRKLFQSQQKEVRTKIFLDTVIEHIPHSIAVKAAQDPTQEVRDWQLILVNKAYEKLTGLSRTKLIGKSVRDLYPMGIADIISITDEDALASTDGVARELPLAPGGDAQRVIAAKKVAIRDDRGKAQYILTVLDDVTEKRRSERRIAHMAHHDTLTDLPNRAALNERFAATLEAASANGEKFAILSIDLDRVKETNDVHGHAAGDRLIQEAACRLQSAACGAFVARIGGDEFIVIVQGGAHMETAEAVAQRLIAAFTDDIEIDGKQIRLSLGIGGAIYPDDGTDANSLMINADAALYRAKAEKRGCVVFFQPEMGIQAKERNALEQDLRQAIDCDELFLHYQPQFRITGEVTGFEALSRWKSRGRGLVPPETFIPIAEESGLIISLGEWALREACSEAATWPLPLTIAVNVSPIQFHHGELPRVVHSILLETGLAPARLELEITEGVLINDFSRAVSILCQLKSLGVKIALDDFGTGYSSLSYLHSFTFDKIKIDRTFVSDLEHNRHSMAIVRAVIGLGHSLEVPVLAEGVETQQQRSFLIQAGCDQVQGYLLGRPFPISRYGELLGLEFPSKQSQVEPTI